MKPLFIIGAVLTLALSFFFSFSWALLWQLPLLFLSVFLGVTLLYWLFWAFACLPIQKQYSYDRPSPFYYRLLQSGYRFAYEGARARVQVTGLDKLPDTPFLLVSNHLSNFDNMIQSVTLQDRQIAYISKPENFDIPIGGRLIWRSCYLPIERDNLRSSTRTIQKAAAMLREGGVSMAVYPEGHRGHSYELQPFHPGCLNAAIWANCPIVVSTITGTEQIHTRFPFRSTEVHFDILETVETNGRRAADLSEEIRQTMQAHLNTYRKG